MQVSCIQENLAKGLGIVGRAVATRSSLAVLSNVLIETDESRLKLAATNLELGITCWIGAMVEEEGGLTVPERLLQDFIASLSADTRVSLRSTDATLRLEAASYKANVRGTPAEEFPPIPAVSDQNSCTVNARELEKAVGQVAFAAATDDTRPALAGVLFSFHDGKLTLAAADGFRLAVCEVTLDRPLAEDQSIIVPARAVQELARIIGGGDDTVEIVITPNRSQVLFHLSSVDLVSRLIEGAFPNYQQIIPTRYTTRITVDTKEFQNANRIASLFARDSNNIVRLNVTGGENGSARLSVAAVADVGDTVGELDTLIEGEAAQIAFNGKYLAEVLSAAGASQVTLDLNSPSSPGVIKAVGDPNYIHVIMPMHVAR